MKIEWPSAKEGSGRNISVLVASSQMSTQQEKHLDGRTQFLAETSITASNSWESTPTAKFDERQVEHVFSRHSDLSAATLGA